MIVVERFDVQPVMAGDYRELVLAGDGPFTISQRCFIDKPKPPGPGFLPCPECSVQRVSSGQVAKIAISRQLWSGKEGEIVIDVSNPFGETLELRLMVQSDFDSTSTATVSF